LGEHLLCKQGVIGSIPFTSTTLAGRGQDGGVGGGQGRRQNTGYRGYGALCSALFEQKRLFFNNWEEVKVYLPGQPGRWIGYDCREHDLGFSQRRDCGKHLML
jgi:hypothetical protein